MLKLILIILLLLFTSNAYSFGIVEQASHCDEEFELPALLLIDKLMAAEAAVGGDAPVAQPRSGAIGPAAVPPTPSGPPAVPPRRGRG